MVSGNGTMYRIFCESYNNYIRDFDSSDVRLGFAAPLGLIADQESFDAEKEKESDEYKKLCDLLYYASQNIDRYPRLKAFLWTISSRGMEPQIYGLADSDTLEEQVKLINSFLRLAYWN